MRPNLPLIGIGLGSGAIALAYGAAFLPALAAAVAPWLMAGGVTLLLLSLLWLGARPGNGRLPRLVAAGLVLLVGVLLGGFGAALVLPPESPGSALWLGLPRRAALLLYGIGLLPGLVLPLVFGLSFARTTLSEAELNQLRDRLARLRTEPPSA